MSEMIIGPPPQTRWQRIWAKLKLHPNVQIAIVGGLFTLAGLWLGSCLDASQLRPQIEGLRAQLSDKDTTIQSKDREIQRLETLLTPFRTLALERYTEPEAEALRKLAGQIQTLESDIEDLKPFELTQQLQQVLISRFTKVVEAEKEKGIEQWPLHFVLFPEQSLDAGELVKFVREVFDSAGRETQLERVINSGIPTNERGVMLTIGDPENPPPLLSAFLRVLSDIGMRHAVIVDKREKDGSLIFTAQRPIYDSQRSGQP